MIREQLLLENQLPQWSLPFKPDSSMTLSSNGFSAGFCNHSLFIPLTSQES